MASPLKFQGVEFGCTRKAAIFPRLSQEPSGETHRSKLNALRGEIHTLWLGLMDARLSARIWLRAAEQRFWGKLTWWYLDSMMEQYKGYKGTGTGNKCFFGPKVKCISAEQSHCAKTLIGWPVGVCHSLSTQEIWTNMDDFTPTHQDWMRATKKEHESLYFWATNIYKHFSDLSNIQHWLVSWELFN